ncbi:MAG: hypothetical protein HY001_01275 [Candidatus Portnoybacteria bacterium]|nr:hypothetical protein [Candidatus Portnoybacteria bacterium]
MKGFVSLAFLLLMIGAISILAGGAAFTALSLQRNIQASEDSMKSYYASQAGIEDASLRIIKGLPYPSSYTLWVGLTQATIAVSQVGQTRTVQSTGDTKSIKKVLSAILTLSTTGVSFPFGTQIGEGGIVMEENSRVEGAGGTAGNVYVNGAVTGDSGAAITGGVTIASGISKDGVAQNTVCNTDQLFGKADPVIDLAQRFIPSQTKPLSKVGLDLKKIGNPANPTIYITNEVSGSPAQSAIASATLLASTVGTNYSWVEVSFPSPPNLTQGTPYWIVFDAKKDANDYWSWCKDSAAGYADGEPKYSKDWDDDPWASVAGDLTFKIYLGIGVSSLDKVVVLGDARVNTITNSKICGDAYYQSIDAGSLTFLNAPSSPTCPSPLTPGTGYSGQPNPPAEPPPISQAVIAQWKNDAAAGGTITGNCGDSGAAECTIQDNGIILLGPKKITGNLVLSKKQTLIVTGTLYIQGHIDMDSSNGATIKCDSSFGSNSCVIVTDSWVHIKNNAAFQGSGQSGSYLLILTTLSNCNGGSQQPSCTHHNAAIDFHNNGTGAIFYAQDSMVNLHNGVLITELTAYKLNLDNNAIVRYEQGLLNAQFSSGPSASLEITSWNEI